jgi:hypothetical protein
MQNLTQDQAIALIRAYAISPMYDSNLPSLVSRLSVADTHLNPYWALVSDCVFAKKTVKNFMRSNFANYTSMNSMYRDQAVVDQISRFWLSEFDELATKLFCLAEDHVNAPDCVKTMLVDISDVCLYMADLIKGCINDNVRVDWQTLTKEPLALIANGCQEFDNL